MTQHQVGKISSASTVAILLGVVQLLGHMGGSSGSSSGTSDNGLTALLNGLQSKQASAASQVQPSGDASTGSDEPDPMQGLMQMLAPLIQMMAPMFGNGNTGTGQGGGTTSSAPSAVPISKAGANAGANAGTTTNPTAHANANANANAAPPAAGSGAFHAKDPSIEQWAPDIQKAAKASGLDPNLIGGQMWRESHGNQGTLTTNIDGTKDIGLMQIGQERWSKVLAPALNATDRAAITAATGKRPEDLNMNDPHDNVIAGAFHLKLNIDKLGGDVHAALTMYVGPNDPTYADSILNKNVPALQAGQNMPDPL